MADWYLKYYYEFMDETNQKYKVEIYEDVVSPPAPAPTKIKADFEPCVINYRNDELYNPVWASGAELSILSTSDRQFFSLYTDDMMKYQVRIFRTYWVTPIYSVQLPVWYGYLVSENYEEDFSFIDNYSVNITANDGFNLLERINYLDDTGENYTGVTSHWDTLFNIINKKLNLPIDFVYVGLSTTPLDYSLQEGETILHTIYQNEENWYDEDNEPENCRKVLENILSIYGAFIIQKEGNLYITDINHIAVSGATFNKYEYSDFTYLTSLQLNLEIGDISSIGVQSNKINFEIEPGINKQVVNYSSYEKNNILEYNGEEDLINQIVESTSTSGSTGFKWTETYYSGSTFWNAFNGSYFCKLQGISTTNKDNIDFYLKINDRGYINDDLNDTISPISFTMKSKLPYLLPTDKYKLKLEMKVYFRTLNDLNNPDEVMVKGISSGELCCRLQIGNEKYGHLHYDIFQWVNDISDPESLILYFKEQPDPFNYLPINDKWMELKSVNLKYLGDDIWFKEENDYLIPIEETMLKGGEIFFSIYGYKVYEMPFFPTQEETTALDCRIKDIRLSVVDSVGKKVSSLDLEYISRLNSNYANEGKKIRIYQGTNTNKHPVQRGNLMVYNGSGYTFSTVLNKEGDTDIPENLLLRSIKSNYGGSNIKLAIDLPINNILGYYTYNNYLYGKKLFPMSNRMNLRQNISELVLREINKDEAVII